MNGQGQMDGEDDEDEELGGVVAYGLKGVGGDEREKSGGDDEDGEDIEGEFVGGVGVCG